MTSPDGYAQSTGDVSRLPIQTPADPNATSANLAAVYRAHGDFLWLTLQRLGVRDDDRDDALQDVLVVVLHRLHTFDARGPMAAWLFGVCVRVAAARRRRAYVRREQLWETVPDDPSAEHPPDPEEALVAAQSRARLRAVLDEMDLEKRAVFVMYELDEVPASEIAAVLGIPFNTVHSRLRAARGQFERIAARHRARDGRRSALVLLPWWDRDADPSSPWPEALRSRPPSPAEHARHAEMLPRLVGVAPAPTPMRGAVKLLGGASVLVLALALVGTSGAPSRTEVSAPRRSLRPRAGPHASHPRRRCARRPRRWPTTLRSPRPDRRQPSRRAAPAV